MKQLILICGFAGAGKTTIGKALAKKLGYAFVDKDTISEDFTDYILAKNGESKTGRESFLYSAEINRLEYVTGLKVCKDIIENGINVVGAFPLALQIESYEKWKLLTILAGIPFDIDIKFIWIKHDIEQEKINLFARKSKKDKNKLANWDDYAASIDGLQIDKEFNCIEIENNAPADVVAQNIIDQLIA